MTIDVKIGITRSFWKSAFGDIDRRYGICICDVDFGWRDADDGTILVVESVDAACFVANVGVVVEPEGCEFWEEWTGNVGEGVQGAAVGGAEEEG